MQGGMKKQHRKTPQTNSKKKAVRGTAIRSFQRTVTSYYKEHGREHLPWRNTRDPYHILVSEIMLQQTQADRVVEKYRAFIKVFPTVTALARAPLGAVLAQWIGLGYNRRAKTLHAAAQRIVEAHSGSVPESESALRDLPGVGVYTAGAVLAFAYNKPVVFIDTNIRSVFIRHFFEGKGPVSDMDLLPFIEAALFGQEPRLWYAALMDYGTLLKKTGVNPGRQSAHYVRQSSFEGSARQLRGAILRMASRKPFVTIQGIVHETRRARTEVETQVARLIEEGFLKKKGARITLG